jgi:16S rRNA (cytosine1402-N4)-methyltransferase
MSEVMEYHDYHEPVLAEETASLLVTLPGIYIDGTLGGGGHSQLLLSRLALMDGRSLLVSIDQDSHALEAAKQKLDRCKGSRLFLRGNFGMIGELMEPVLQDDGVGMAVMGFLLDLGVSSFQIDTPDRGFSYLRDGPLDMRMDPDGPVTAADIVNGYEEAALARIFFRYGEEPFAGRIAKMLVAARRDNPVKTTGELAGLVRQACPRKDMVIKTLSRVYQALRIEVNDELGVLERALQDGFSLLSAGGRFAVISYHSLEDRIVKRFFSDRCAADWGPKGIALRAPLKPAEGMMVTRKPVLATAEEISRNPRSRSARLRVIQKL